MAAALFLLKRTLANAPRIITRPARPISLGYHTSSSSSNHGFRRSFKIPSVAASAAGIGIGVSFFLFSTHSDPAAQAAVAEAVDLVTPPESNTMAGPVITKSGSKIAKFRVYVGYDPREDLAYEVCRHSLLKHSSVPVEVIPIKQSELRRLGLYSRTRDPTESTEFSFTRFLTPCLAGYEGWAMFVDCDFLYTSDIRELLEMADDRYAIMCVQHNYAPTSSTKMDGVVQTTYPRKNWSSMVLYNCSHPKNKVLTPAVVNSQSGAFLHRFMWLDEKDIGSIPFTWNFLVGHNRLPDSDASPKAIHYTMGGPWFEAWRDCPYAELWLKEKDEYLKSRMTQKVIQDELISVLDKHMNERTSQLEERLAFLEGKVKEVSALQHLLLFYLQPKIAAPEKNGKEAKLDADQYQLEDKVVRAFHNFGGKDY